MNENYKSHFVFLLRILIKKNRSYPQETSPGVQERRLGKGQYPRRDLSNCVYHFKDFFYYI